ncbi:MAG TPA: hypothetical protein VFP58_12245 [Candidatus Eisenbacteria bacterium]|nr:hypothetical protein [Candidatus Eisenbacteria bacterium]
MRSIGERFEIVTTRGTREVFFRGVNMGAAPPGRFPGEFAITDDDYRRWLRFLRDLRANAVRVYALHPPAFYRILREENEAHPDRPIWLFQEVWTELPEGNDFWDSTYTRGFEDEIRLAIDAVHGNVVAPQRPGHASGRYESDVSPWLAGWILGREWEPYAVRETERRRPDSTRYRGEYFEVNSGTPMETWLARVCDTAASYEARRYGLARAVSFVNWPTLDPMRHPTETERGGVEAEHDEDAYSVDPARIRARKPAGLESGFLGYFANYHVYPYYPDFMNLDPGYGRHRDRHGVCRYAGYLADLKAHTRGIPLLIGEYGVPTSRGIAHLHPEGLHHGGASEEEQGARDVRLLEDIVESGCAGSLLFSLFDEWFKVNWIVERVERPRDRDPMWLNRLDAEENYGLLAFDPPPVVRIDGSFGDWEGVEPYARAENTDARRAPLRTLRVTSDATRFYLALEVARGTLDSKELDVGISFDVLDSARGDARLPSPLRGRWSRGAEYVLRITPPHTGVGSNTVRVRLLADDAMSWSAFARLRSREGSFGRSRKPLRPVANENGEYVPLWTETNRERVSRDGTLYRAQYVDWGELAPGVEPSLADTAGNGYAYAYDPRAEVMTNPDRTRIELAVPWGLLGVGDPSSRSVMDDRDGTSEIEVTPTEGIGLLAWAAKGETVLQALGPPGTRNRMKGRLLTVTTPARSNHSWNEWEVPITRERAKRSTIHLRKAFEGMEAREASQNRNAEERR